MWDLIQRYKFISYSVAAILLVLIIFIALIVDNRARVRDVMLLSELKSVSSALESYYTAHRQYPAADNLNLNQPFMIADAATAVSDKKVYYNDSIQTAPVLYNSDGQTYRLSFRLNRQWSELGSTGRNCTITEGFIITCRK